MARKQITEQAVLSICRKYGGFDINPLAYSARRNLHVLESMRKRGILKRKCLAINNHKYIVADMVREESK